MTTEAELAPRPLESSASLADKDLHHILEFDQIVKLSEAVTAGKHPRIKIPPHLVRSSPNPTTSLPPNGQSNHGAKAEGTVSSVRTKGRKAKGSGARDALAIKNLVAFKENGQLPTGAAMTKPPTRLEAASNARAVSPKNASQDELFSERSRLEALIREKASQSAKFNMASATQIDLWDLLQKARELERTFAPPLIGLSTLEKTTDFSDVALKHRMAATASSVAADSVDDQTFYSSNFSTPEFALTSRIPIEEGNDDVSMHDSSDYEPELDNVTSSKLPPQPQSRPPLASHHQQISQLQQLQQLQQLPQVAFQHLAPEQLAPHITQIPGQTPGRILTSLLGPNYDPNTLTRHNPLLPVPAALEGTAHTPSADVAALLAAWGHQLPGLSKPPQLEGGTSTSSHRKVAAGNPKPPSPFVRTHNLSPIAPQPAHISSLAMTKQLPLEVERQQDRGQGQHTIQQGVPAQVVSLRRGEAPQSSPDSSPYLDGNNLEKRKGKKKATGKRKFDVRPSSPRIKPEPRSPSPIMALPVHRPRKRQRQENYIPQAAAYGYQDRRRSPPPHTAPYAAVQPSADVQEPLIIERVERGHYVQQPRYGEQTDYDEVYETSIPGYIVPRQVQADRRYPVRPPSAHPAAPSSQSGLRSARAASHALVETSSGYATQFARDEYNLRDYETSGRMSTRPMAMAPPHSRLQQIPQPSRGRIVVDEYNREYYEPAPHQATVARSMTYEPNVTLERPVSRLQHASGPGRRDGGYAFPQAPQAEYDDEIVYRRTSPAYVSSRRVVTQPEYVSREPVSYTREFTARPAPQYPAAGGPLPGRTYVMNEALQVADNLPPASGGRPHEAAGHEVPPPGRYVKRVGSVRPPPDGNGSYSAERGYGERRLVREYSTQPEPHVAVHRAYSVHPPHPSHPPPAPMHYGEQGYVPLAEGYYYPEIREVYR
ncbi:hypothetical protein SEPCBS57363_003481 [Sporothrix epigloea]|uniref:Uncharacterized protein n=1 Tax=Sporothrix epigloea TaxID=1892477 RepID=A0ABP0DQB1_9PEZI